MKEVSALDRQVGGDHYLGFPVQPAAYITLNRLGWLQGCVVKRISRYDKPTGKGLEDLEKIIHEVEMIIEIEGWRETP